MAVRVQKQDFDLGEEISALTQGNHGIGAIVSFTGVVRDTGDLMSMTLEHYPGMTEASLADIEAQAQQRWPLEASLIIHRFGKLCPGENIMAVVTASAHRKAAFEAAEFLMDYLKTEAPFWKLEDGPKGQAWVSAQDADQKARKKWDTE